MAAITSPYVYIADVDVLPMPHLYEELVKVIAQDEPSSKDASIILLDIGYQPPLTQLMHFLFSY